MALPLLRDGLAPRRVRFAAQSNLWLLTDELCELFAEHGVSLGTSLDGPEALNRLEPTRRGSRSDAEQRFEVTRRRPLVGAVQRGRLDERPDLRR
jgi:uncharacterized protein